MDKTCIYKFDYEGKSYCNLTDGYCNVKKCLDRHPWDKSL